MAFSSTLTPTPAVGKAIPYTWFTTLLANDNDINDRATTSYSPTWGNTGTANTLGNGTLSGFYWRLGKYVFFRVALTWGGTTASGSADWTFTLPVTADSFGVAGGVHAIASDVSASQFYPISAINVSSTTFKVMTTASPMVAVGTAAPFTWASGDALNIVGWFIAA